MICGAYGMANHSLIEVSETLKRLHVSHTIAGGLRYLQMDIDGLCDEQPAWPVVTDLRSVRRGRVHQINRTPMILFVCGSRAELAQTNLQRDLWNLDHVPFHLQLGTALKSVDLNWKFEFVENSKTVDDYVKAASKPSFLSDLITLILKVHPYDLRKEIQATCIGYLDSRVSWAKVRRLLKGAGPRPQLIYEVMQKDAVEKLKAAVAQFRQGREVNALAKEAGLDQFEIMYVVKSMDRAHAPKKESKSKKGRTT